MERNFFLTRRYWGWEIAFLIYSVAGALSISLIGADQGDADLTLMLMIGRDLLELPLVVVFSWIAETISVERWEGTLEYTMMAPIRRSSHLLGSVLYAMVYGLIHTAAILVVLILFFPELDVTGANPATVVTFVVLGSFSIVGIGMIAAILPLLYVERGAQMTFVLQSCLLLVSGVYYSIEVLPGWMQVLSRLSPATYVLDGVRKGVIRRAGERAPSRRLAADRDGRLPHPVRPVGVRARRALREAHRKAEAGRMTGNRSTDLGRAKAAVRARGARARTRLVRRLVAAASRRTPAPAACRRGSSPRTAARTSSPAPPASCAAPSSGRFRFEADDDPAAFPAVGDWVVDRGRHGRRDRDPRRPAAATGARPPGGRAADRGPGRRRRTSTSSSSSRR